MLQVEYIYLQSFPKGVAKKVQNITDYQCVGQYKNNQNIYYCFTNSIVILIFIPVKSFIDFCKYQLI